jgi:hypothetical protein
MKDGNPAFAYVHRARATVARAHAPTNKVVVCMSEGCVRAQEAKMTE